MLVASILSGLASDAVQAVASAIASAAGALLKAIFATVSGATTITPDASWFSGGPTSPVGIVAGIAGAIVLLLFLLQIGRSLIHREGAGLVRALTGTFRAVWGTAIFLAVLTTALSVTDSLCNFIVAQGLGSIGSAGGHLLAIGALTALVATDPFAVIVLGLLMIAGAVMLYATLLIRSVSIYAVAVAGPIVMAGQVYDGTRSWLRRWVEVLGALVFSKLAIVLLFVLGTAMIAGSTGVTSLLGGVVVVGMASFSPLLVYKLFHFVGMEAAGMVHGAVHGAASSGLKSAGGSLSGSERVQSLMTPMSVTPRGSSSAAGAAGQAAMAAQRATAKVTETMTTPPGSGTQSPPGQPGSGNEAAGSSGASSTGTRAGSPAGKPQSERSSSPTSTRSPSSPAPTAPAASTSPSANRPSPGTSSLSPVLPPSPAPSTSKENPS